MPAQKLVNGTLTDANQIAVKASIDTAKSLLPFLITLTSKEKSRLRKMGPKSVEYVNLNLKGATNFPDYIPVSFDTQSLMDHSTLIDQLTDIRIVTASLLESIDDTIIAASSDAMVAADEVYLLLKTAANHDSAVKKLVTDIAKRFVGQGKPKTPPTI